MTALSRFAALGLLLLLPACGDIPQPFRHEGLNHAVVPVGARGVVVLPVEDTPRGNQLAEIIVRRLLAAEIAASTRPVAPGAGVIAAEVEPGAGLAHFRWHLLGPEGVALGGLEQRVPVGAWGRATPKTLELMAAEVVEKLSPALLGDDGGPEAAALRPTVRLEPLSGAPGDGDKALAAAMRRILEGNGLQLVEGEADFVVRGQVTLAPGRADEELLAVSWTVSGRDGAALGSAAQQGGVPKGRLSGPWGSLAADIAAGGVDGVMQILRAAMR